MQNLNDKIDINDEFDSGPKQELTDKVINDNKNLSKSQGIDDEFYYGPEKELTNKITKEDSYVKQMLNKGTNILENIKEGAIKTKEKAVSTIEKKAEDVLIAGAKFYLKNIVGKEILNHFSTEIKNNSKSPKSNSKDKNSEKRGR